MEWKCPECGSLTHYDTSMCPCGHEADGTEGIIRDYSSGAILGHHMAAKISRVENVMIGSVTMVYVSIIAMIMNRREYVVLSLLVIIFVCAVIIGECWMKLPKNKNFYAVSYMLLFLAMLFTVGVINNEHKTVSTVTGLQVEKAKGSINPWGRCVVKVACKFCSQGYLITNMGENHCDNLHTGDTVRVQYVQQSILGLWGEGAVLEKINDATTMLSGGLGFRGGLIDKLISMLLVIAGIIPLCYLIWLDRNKKQSSRKTA